MKIPTKTALVLTGVISVLAISLYIYTHQPIYHIPSDNQSLENITFYALGDQGTGHYRQWEVSHAMENLAEKEHNLDFVVLMGDNFYTKSLSSVDSPEWLSRFEHVYSGNYLSAVPYYAVLGNHDHGNADGNNKPRVRRPEVQIEYSRKHMGSNRWRMPDWYYSADFGKAQGRPLLRMVFIDTNLKHEELLKEADFIRGQFQDTSNAPVWKIVVGHHPIRNYGKHQGEESEKEMTATILPALQDAHVDLYLSGHDHNQQVIAREGEPFYFINGSGGAGKLYPIKTHPQDLVFSRTGHGFIRVNLDGNTLRIGNYDSHGTAVSSYKFERTCAFGVASCLETIPH